MISLEGKDEVVKGVKQNIAHSSPPEPRGQQNESTEGFALGLILIFLPLPWRISNKNE
jgi:hypothetical protein